MSANGKKKKAEEDAREAERRRMESEKARLEQRGAGKTKRTPPQPRGSEKGIGEESGAAAEEGSEVGGGEEGAVGGMTISPGGTVCYPFNTSEMSSEEEIQRRRNKVKMGYHLSREMRREKEKTSPELKRMMKERDRLEDALDGASEKEKYGLHRKLAALEYDEADERARLARLEALRGMTSDEYSASCDEDGKTKYRGPKSTTVLVSAEDIERWDERKRALQREKAEELARLAADSRGMRSGSPMGSQTSGEEGKKRKKTGEEEGEEEEGARSIVDWIRELEDVLETMGKKKAVSVGEKTRIKDVIDGLRREEMKARVEIGYWKGRSQGVEMNIEGIKKELGEIRNELKEMGSGEVSAGKERDRQSYAGMVGGGDRGEGRSSVPGVTGVRGRIPRISSVVLIRHETKQAEEVKKVVKEIVDPVVVDVNVRRVNLIKNGIRVETGTEEEVGKLIGHKGLLDAGMKVGRPERKKPVIMIYDMPQRLSDDEIRAEVYLRTMKDSGVEEVEFKENFDVKHRYKNRGGRDGDKEKEHVVVRCNGRIRNWIRRRERIFMGWESCRVKDYMDVVRCYKCQGFGHVAKYCDRKVCCERCTGEHDRKDCQKGRDEARCVNCGREGKEEVRHEAGDKECPIYLRAEKRYLESVDYSV